MKSDFEIRNPNLDWMKLCNLIASITPRHPSKHPLHNPMSLNLKSNDKKLIEPLLRSHAFKTGYMYIFQWPISIPILKLKSEQTVGIAVDYSKDSMTKNLTPVIDYLTSRWWATLDKCFTGWPASKVKQKEGGLQFHQDILPLIHSTVLKEINRFSSFNHGKKKTPLTHFFKRGINMSRWWRMFFSIHSSLPHCS